jgi:hypothetical protein
VYIRLAIRKTTTIENLGKKDLVFGGRPAVFAPNFPGASFAEGLYGIWRGVHGERDEVSGRD